MEKIIFIVVVWIAYVAAFKFFYPLSTINETLHQLSDSNYATSTLFMQQLAWKLSIIIPVILTIGTFKDKLIEIYYKIRNYII